MITALVIILLFGGSTSGLNLSDPAALQVINQSVSKIIPNPKRAAEVSGALQQLGFMSWEAKKPKGFIAEEIETLGIVTGYYDASPEQVFSAVRNLEFALSRVNQNAVNARETIRQNTTESEWNRLLRKAAR